MKISTLFLLVLCLSITSCKNKNIPSESPPLANSKNVHDEFGEVNVNETHQIATKKGSNYELVDAEMLLKNWNQYFALSRVYTDFTQVQLVEENGQFLLRASNDDQTIRGLILLEEKDKALYHMIDQLNEYCTVICEAKHVDKGCLPQWTNENDRIEYSCEDITIGICEKSTACRNGLFLTIEEK